MNAGAKKRQEMVGPHRRAATVRVWISSKARSVGGARHPLSRAYHVDFDGPQSDFVTCAIGVLDQTVRSNPNWYSRSSPSFMIVDSRTRRRCICADVEFSSRT